MIMSIADRILLCLSRNNNMCSLTKIATDLPDTKSESRAKAIQCLIDSDIIEKKQIIKRRFNGKGRMYKKTILRIKTHPA